MGSVIFSVCLIAIIVGTVLFAQTRYRRAFVDAAERADDTDVLQQKVAFHPPIIAVHRHGRVAHVATARKNSDDLGTWEIQVPGLRLAERTSLTVSRESVLNALGKLINQTEVTLGVPSLDDKYWIRGDDPEIVRAVFGDPAVQAAVERLFDGRRGAVFQLDQQGCLWASMKRPGLKFEDAHQAAHDVLDLCQALEGSASGVVPRLRVPPEQPLAAAGAASGVPVGVGVRED